MIFKLNYYTKLLFSVMVFFINITSNLVNASQSNDSLFCERDEANNNSPHSIVPSFPEGHFLTPLPELRLSILNFLPHNDQLNARLVSTQWKQSVDENFEFGAESITLMDKFLQGKLRHFAPPCFTALRITDISVRSDDTKSCLREMLQRAPSLNKISSYFNFLDCSIQNDMVIPKTDIFHDLKLDNLTFLFLNHNSLKDHEFKLIIKNFHNLQKLDVSNFELNSSFIHANITRNWFTYNAFTELPEHKKLRKLLLKNCVDLGYQIAKNNMTANLITSTLTCFPTLQKLSLLNNNFNDDDIELFQQALGSRVEISKMS